MKDPVLAVGVGENQPAVAGERISRHFVTINNSVEQVNGSKNLPYSRCYVQGGTKKTPDYANLNVTSQVFLCHPV